MGCEVCYNLLGELFNGERQQLPEFIKDFRCVKDKVMIK